MKNRNLFLKLVAGAALGSCLAQSSHGQIGFDVFQATKSYVLAPLQNIQYTVGLTVTNPPVDLVKLAGTVKVDFNTYTNTGTTGGTLSALVQTSPDQTNWITLQNYAVIPQPSTELLTNNFYGPASVIATNNVLLPGVYSYPNKYSAGYATPSLNFFQYTNVTVVSLNPTNVTEIGFDVRAESRYYRVIYVPGGAITNFTADAVVTGSYSVQ